jgi:RNA polymerase sigma-70 factor (ECF subfamily)
VGREGDIARGRRRWENPRESVAEDWPVSDEALDFSRIYEVYHGKVVAYAAKLLGRDEADDIAQEVFVKIRRSLSAVSDSSKLTSWIYTITLNTVRDAARRQRPASARRNDEGDAAISRLPDPGSCTPEENAIRNEMVACYLDYVRQLPPRYQEVYILREFEDLTSEETARRLSLSVGTVKIRLHRARTALNGELRRNCQCYYNERGELMGEPKE